MKIRLALAAMALFWAGVAFAAAPGEQSEMWQGKVLGASFRAGVCYDARGRARGVLLLTHASGQTDVYHLNGVMAGGSFELRHGSGHVFSGSLDSSSAMSGRVRLANGLRLSLKGRRIFGQPLAQDCAPLAK